MPFDPACADVMRKLSEYDKAECYKKFLYMLKTLMAIPISSCCYERSFSSLGLKICLMNSTSQTNSMAWHYYVYFEVLM